VQASPPPSSAAPAAATEDSDPRAAAASSAVPPPRRRPAADASSSSSLSAADASAAAPLSELSQALLPPSPPAVGTASESMHRQAHPQQQPRALSSTHPSTPLTLLPAPWRRLFRRSHRLTLLSQPAHRHLRALCLHAGGGALHQQGAEGDSQLLPPPAALPTRVLRRGCSPAPSSTCCPTSRGTCQLPPTTASSTVRPKSRVRCRPRRHEPACPLEPACLPALG
jgi:hypothetical protein